MSDEKRPLIDRETYLGDGLYASHNGYMIRLRTPRERGDDCVYLEPSTLAAFEIYVARIKAGLEELSP